VGGAIPARLVAEHRAGVVSDIAQRSRELAAAIGALPLAERVAALNEVRAALHAVNPFAAEPVDFVE
jgi:hypothetical protein